MKRQKNKNMAFLSRLFSVVRKNQNHEKAHDKMAFLSRLFSVVRKKARIMKRHTTKYFFFCPDYFPENFANSELKQDYIFA